MQPHDLASTYMVPITMGRQATATQNVFQSIRSTAGADVVPLRVVSLQRLDCPGQGRRTDNLGL